MVTVLGTTRLGAFDSMLDETFERVHVKVQVGGKRVLWSARLLLESAYGHTVSDDVIAYDELQFETLPANPGEDAIRLASTVEVICHSIGPEIPARLTFEFINYNHAGWETETLQ